MLETLYAIPTIYVFIYMNKYFNREEILKKELFATKYRTKTIFLLSSNDKKSKKIKK